MESMEKYRVFEDSSKQGVFYIIDEKYIEERNFCEAFNDYGQIIGCYDAGCWIKGGNGITEKDWEENPEECHIPAIGIWYWDGNNHQTKLIGCGELDIDGYYCDLVEVDNEIEKEILEEFKKVGEPATFEYNCGYCEKEGEKYEFAFSLFGSSAFYIAEVKSK